ncbi:MAG: alpha/beta hydrolase [Terrimonas sp.]|nr:alpha/beta hydrolase [Terrimonas sp.]
MEIRSGKTWLRGDLAVPASAASIVIFAHGSGSSRMSIRNRQVAKRLNEAGMGTLLFDLLTANEDMHYPNRFNIDLLAQRLMGATEWMEHFKLAEGFDKAYFGASTGAAAALIAAAHLREIKVVISRGGRADLAGPMLPFVQAPVLLIVGSLDHDVLALNRQAYDQLTCEKELTIVNGATHLFEEPGKMEAVVDLSIAWLKKHLQTV